MDQEFYTDRILSTSPVSLHLCYVAYSGYILAPHPASAHFILESFARKCLASSEEQKCFAFAHTPGENEVLLATLRINSCSFHAEIEGKSTFRPRHGVAHAIDPSRSNPLM